METFIHNNVKKPRLPEYHNVYQRAGIVVTISVQIT